MVLTGYYTCLPPSPANPVLDDSSATFNPLSTPHFGGIWEHEIKLVKTALHLVLGNRQQKQSVLVEVEGILNSKPLGHAQYPLTWLTQIQSHQTFC